MARSRKGKKKSKERKGDVGGIRGLDKAGKYRKKGGHEKEREEKIRVQG